MRLTWLPLAPEHILTVAPEVYMPTLRATFFLPTNFRLRRVLRAAIHEEAECWPELDVVCSRGSDPCKLGVEMPHEVDLDDGEVMDPYPHFYSACESAMAAAGDYVDGTPYDVLEALR